MTDFTFNLIDSPWIPVVTGDGCREEIGLRDAFLRAPELREVEEPIPIVECGLYRLLVALAGDIYNLSLGGMNAWGRLLSEGEWPQEAVDAYFLKWRDRFDLFAPKKPFLQTATGADEKPKPLAALLPAIPSGTNANHFHHAQEEEFGVSPAAAARLLTTIAPFMTAGGAGLAPSINGAPPWYVLIRGRNLFETVLLNTYADRLPQEIQGAPLSPPAWRSDRTLQSERRKEAGALEALTWQPRRIRLLAGPGGVCSLTGQAADVIVRTMHFSAGESVDFNWHDPHVPYKLADAGRLPLRPREGRQIWRDSGPLTFLKNESYGKDEKTRYIRPAVIDQLELAASRDYLSSDTELRFTAYGMRTDMKMKVFEWYRESLSLPFAFVVSEATRRIASKAMRQSEDIAFALRRAVKTCYPRGAEGNKEGFGALADFAERSFWNALYPAHETFLRRIASNKITEENADQEWEAAVKPIALAVLGETIDDLDSDDEALKRWAIARQRFQHSLHSTFHPEHATAKSGKKSKKGGS